MNYLNLNKNIHTLDNFIHDNNTDYNYSDFLRDMEMYESAMYSTILNCAKDINRTSIKSITEAIDVDKNIIKDKNDTMNDSLKNIWMSINDKFITFITSKYNKTNKFLSKKKVYVDNNKNDILNITLTNNLYGCEGKCKKISKQIKIHSNILKKFPNVPLNKSIISDKNSIKPFYLNTYLGEINEFTANEINDTKKIIIDNFYKAIDEIGKYKAILETHIESNPNRKLNDDKMSKYQTKIENLTYSYKILCDTLSTYCTDIVSVLKLFR